MREAAIVFRQAEDNMDLTSLQTCKIKLSAMPDDNIYTQACTHHPEGALYHPLLQIPVPVLCQIEQE
jgi:hypothetical protein